MTAVQRFKAMGCEVLVAGASMQELRAIRDLFDGRERRFRLPAACRHLCHRDRALRVGRSGLGRGGRARLGDGRFSSGRVGCG